MKINLPTKFNIICTEKEYPLLKYALQGIREDLIGTQYLKLNPNLSDNDLLNMKKMLAVGNISDLFNMLNLNVMRYFNKIVTDILTLNYIGIIPLRNLISAPSLNKYEDIYLLKQMDKYSSTIIKVNLEGIMLLDIIHIYFNGLNIYNIEVPFDYSVKDEIEFTNIFNIYLERTEREKLKLCQKYKKQSKLESLKGL